MLPFDLHVLSMPPAFNLSHDQTLQFNLSTRLLEAKFCLEINRRLPYAQFRYFGYLARIDLCAHTIA